MKEKLTFINEEWFGELDPETQRIALLPIRVSSYSDTRADDTDVDPDRQSDTCLVGDFYPEVRLMAFFMQLLQAKPLPQGCSYTEFSRSQVELFYEHGLMSRGYAHSRSDLLVGFYTDPGGEQHVQVLREKDTRY